MKKSAAEPPLELKSPQGRVRIELAIETLWIGSTVYPDALVWRTWYEGRQMVAAATVARHDVSDVPAWGMRRRGDAHYSHGAYPEAGRELCAHFVSQDGGQLQIVLRVTETSVICQSSISSGETATGRDASPTLFPEGSVLLGADGEALQATRAAAAPQVRYVPGGKLVAFWRRGRERHLQFFDRPGDLAAERFGVIDLPAALEIPAGRLACELLFTLLPFGSSGALPSISYGDSPSPVFRLAFALISQGGAGADDFFFMRGEPGEFAVAARRDSGVWRVACVSAAAQVLTVRFEDLWLRLPPQLRGGRYGLRILRDPNAADTAEGREAPMIDETFTAQAPDVRVVLELADSGGFLLEFWPESEPESASEPATESMAAHTPLRQS